MASTNITINIVEPGSSTPIDPSTSIDPVVPNTGLFTHGIGGPEATIIISISVALIILAILAILSYRKYKKTGKVTKLVRITNQCKTIIKSKKRITAGLAALALLVSAGTFMVLTKNGVNATDTDDQVEDEEGLTVNVNSNDLTIEVGDEPVFAVLPVEVSVEQATQAGYTLTAYANSTDLVSTTNPNNKIPMVAVEGDGLMSLTDNTWGLSLTEPKGKDGQVYTVLSADQTNPTIIKTIDDYSETEANDTTTIYYGFYITPNIPYGTYTGSDIYYGAEKNIATILTFDGNGSDGGEDMESIIIPAGDTIALPENTYIKEGYEFTGWNTVDAPTELDPGKSYADKELYYAETESANVTFFAQWKKLPAIGDLTYMQDFATLSESGRVNVLGSMAQEVAYTLKDKRDEQEYTVAKLKDGNVWMTKNLNLAGGLAISSELSDVPGGYILPVENGFRSENKLPGSSQVEFNDNTKAFLYNSNRTQCGSSTPCYSYYSWIAATAGSGLNVTEANVDAPYSICPKGWKLPKSRVNLDGNVDIYNFSDFYQLGVAYDMMESYPSFYGKAGPGTAPNFLLAGAYRRGSFNFGGRDGGYWSSSSRSDTEAIKLSINSTYSSSSDSSWRGDGLSIRCLAR